MEWGIVDTNVVLLRREGNQTVVVTDVADVRGWRLDQILTSELFGLKTAHSPASASCFRWPTTPPAVPAPTTPTSLRKRRSC